MKREKNIQQITFDLTPTNLGVEVGHAHYVVNTLTLRETHQLEEIVREKLPTAKEALTEKTIIRTDRYKCPCCNPNMDITALVRVRCQGTADEWREIDGLYEIVVSPVDDWCKVVVKKLSGTVIYPE